MVKLGCHSNYASKKSSTKEKDGGMSDSGEASSYLHVQHVGGTKSDHKGSSSKRCRAISAEVKRNHLIVALLLVSVVGNVFLGIVLGFMKTLKDLKSPEREATVFKDSKLDKSVCVPCSSLGFGEEDVNSYLPDNIDRVVIGEFYMCCVRNSEHIQRLISVFSVHYGGAKDTLADTSSNNHGENGAHLYLDSMLLRDNGLVWTDEYGFGSAYVLPGIEKLNSSLKIKQEGRYYVYSFITAKSREISENINFLHTVHRQNSRLPNLGKKLLLIGKQSFPRESEKFITSYLGACLVLRAGDEIFVTVDPESSVYAFAPASYFGLYKVE